MTAQPQSLEEVKKYVIGTWKSLTTELRPTEDRTGAGTVSPTYLTREFTYHDEGTFTGMITMYADNYGEFPLMAFEFQGSLEWGDRHPIAEGAWNIGYILSKGFAVTPLHPRAADMLNHGRPGTIEPFVADQKNDILQKEFPLFNIVEGQIVTDYDLLYFKHGLLFMGAKHVDGTPFDEPERRPHQLQIPLQRA
ncbi:hypothetical protein Lepto7376_2944 [[Leptolyngbya] sp. PCC 7376]|uniref:hypothetical protein n=1 Tax=[Leptolyngbya] sp. PCC 7376 TaxID=111781 RepID=UPI00029F1437|nr:hypothetical protein [[Leptolyngbya] sp. PCC 7376]AFY39194.1 hypothetical protein Lepto7376_2944 [[Leptolyngbya] sp. PCC 7376]